MLVLDVYIIIIYTFKQRQRKEERESRRTTICVHYTLRDEKKS